MCVCVFPNTSYKQTTGEAEFPSFRLTIAPPGRGGSDIQRAFPPVLVLAGLDVWGEGTTAHQHANKLISSSGGEFRPRLSLWCLEFIPTTAARITDFVMGELMGQMDVGFMKGNVHVTIH